MLRLQCLTLAHAHAVQVVTRQFCSFGFAPVAERYDVCHSTPGPGGTAIDDAGVGDDIQQYLFKRGITTTGVMAATASTVAELDSTVVQPLESGFVLETTARLARAQQSTSGRDCTGARAHAHGNIVNNEPFEEGASCGMVGKADCQVRGRGQQRAQTLPQKQLLGAEAVLARIVYEETHDCQTALSLHEIVQARLFTSSAEPALGSQAEVSARQHEAEDHRVERAGG